MAKGERVVSGTEVDKIKETFIDEELQDKPKHERDSILSKRKDDLDEAAERLSDEHEHYKIDPSKIGSDREILDIYEKGYGEVTNAQPGYVYKWVYYGQQLQQVWIAKAIGWRVVTGKDLECPELKEADGTRRWGDTLLMRISRERYEEIQKLEEDRRRMQQEGITSRIIELGEKAQRSGIKVITDPTEREMQRGGNLMKSMQKRAAARAASKTRTKLIKEGRVPGMPAPGTR